MSERYEPWSDDTSHGVRDRETDIVVHTIGEASLLIEQLNGYEERLATALVELRLLRKELREAREALKTARADLASIFTRAGALSGDALAMADRANEALSPPSAPGDPPWLTRETGSASKPGPSAPGNEEGA